MSNWEFPIATILSSRGYRVPSLCWDDSFWGWRYIQKRRLFLFRRLALLGHFLHLSGVCNCLCISLPQQSPHGLMIYDMLCHFSLPSGVVLFQSVGAKLPRLGFPQVALMNVTPGTGKHRFEHDILNQPPLAAACGLQRAGMVQSFELQGSTRELHIAMENGPYYRRFACRNSVCFSIANYYIAGGKPSNRTAGL